MLPADLKRLELLELRFSIVHNLNRTAERLEAINWANSKEPADRGSLEDPPPPSFAETFENQTIERLKTELYKMPLEFMFTHEWKHLAWHAVDSFIDAAEVPDAEARSLLPHFLRKGVSEPIYIIPTPLIDPRRLFRGG